MRTTIAAALLFVAAGAFAAVSPELQSFGNGPAKHIMTPREVKQWKGPKSDAEAQAFIDLFWAKRDPTPDTPKNEYREKFDLRVADADKLFGTENKKGSMTDRGKVLILLGSPTRREDPTVVSVAADVEDSRRQTGRTERWYYVKADLPEGFRRAELEVSFFDPSGKGEFGLNVGVNLGADYTNRALMFDTLDRARDQSIVSPNLTRAPVFGVVEEEAKPVRAPKAKRGEVDHSLRTASLRAAVERMRKGEVVASQAVLSWSEMEAEEGKIHVPIHLLIPPVAGAAPGASFTVFGAVVNAAGETVATFEDPVTLSESRGDVYFDRLLQLPPGKYDAVAGVARDGSPVAMGRAAMSVEGETEVSAASRLILSNNVYQMKLYNQAEPFSFSGMKVVPKGDSVFRKDDSLWLVFQVRNPALDPDGFPEVRAKMIARGVGSDALVTTEDEDVPAIALNASEKIFWVASSVPLSSFSAGEYEVTVTVTDALANRNWDLTRKFSVAE